MKEKTEKTGKAGRDEKHDYMRQVEELVEKFPELKGKTIPEEVIRAVMEGKTLVEAYEDYLAEQSLQYFAADGERQMEEKPHRRTADNAPVKGVSGGSAVGEQGEDDFLRGFNADYRTH